MKSKLDALLEKYRQGRKISVLTCYDCPTALCLDRAGTDIIFIGDSVGTNVLGYASVNEVTMEDMLHHTRAVARGTRQGLVMSDMPFRSFTTPAHALKNAKQLLDAGAEMIKVEGGEEVSEIVKALHDSEIPVMAHIGFTPQTARAGSCVVGAKAEEAVKLYRDAIALTKSGASMIVLECVPEKVAKEVTERISIPTIGIGSGRFCSGQVLVITDLLGWRENSFRFTTRYARFAEETEAAARRFSDEIESGRFPGEENIFRLKQTEYSSFLATLDAPGKNG